LTSSETLASCEAFIEDTRAQLKRMIEGISLLGELTPRSMDHFASQGELLSSKILAPAMAAAGIPSVWFDARDVVATDDRYTSATPQLPTIQSLAKTLLDPLVERNQIVVTQGFIGRSKTGSSTTLGRGGSDYTAALLGAVMNAKDIEIWTDVDGVLTADPKMVHGAKRVKEMTFQEAAELAYFGAKVLHPATIVPAVEKNIPVHVFNTHNPHSSGTLITAKDRSESRHPSCMIKSIAYKKNVTILNIVSSRMLLAHGFLAGIFDVFKRNRTSVDVVSTTEVSVSLSVDQTDFLDAILEELREFSQVTTESQRAIVCLVGEQMRYTPGIAARTFNAIRDVNINMISQGASEINLTFVIDQEDLESVVRRLHDEFFSGVLPSDLFE
jgi:aspartate kinase